jgi:hypothetical protein
MSDTTLTDANAALHIAYVVDPSRNTFSACMRTDIGILQQCELKVYINQDDSVSDIQTPSRS